MQNDEIKSQLKRAAAWGMVIVGSIAVILFVGQELGFWNPEPPIPPQVFLDGMDLIQQGVEYLTSDFIAPPLIA